MLGSIPREGSFFVSGGTWDAVDNHETLMRRRKPRLRMGLPKRDLTVLAWNCALNGLSHLLAKSTYCGTAAWRDKRL